jgi:alkaline phosphatase D
MAGKWWWCFQGKGCVDRRLAVMKMGTILLALHLLHGFTFPVCAQAEPRLTHGPLVGHATTSTARVWARCAEPGQYELVACGVEDPRAHCTVATATAANDHCVVWSLSGLVPNAQYTYRIRSRGNTISDGAAQHFNTAPDVDSATITTLAFGSCAREDAGSAGVWEQMERDDPDAVVLLGDTPYIDSTDLDHQRTRYREFAAVPQFERLLQGRSLYATWDDHDFGRNDTNGDLPGKETSRRVFLEYHANPSYGDGTQGIYTRFRWGPVDVFLLDTRYFAAVEPSPFDPEKRSLLGAKQWRWLQSELQASSGPFKILAAGMIWNGAVRPDKTDHWGTYADQWQALLKFLGRERITGVVLVGGDIHRTRVLRHDTIDTVGYRLTELITSPMHEGIIEAANAPHPNLIFDAGMPHSYLLLEADACKSPAILTARFKNSAGEVFHCERLVESSLRAARAIPPGPASTPAAGVPSVGR